MGESGLCLNPKKHNFTVPFGNLLSHIVTKDGLFTDPTKVALILNFPLPHTIKQLKRVSRVNLVLPSFYS